MSDIRFVALMEDNLCGKGLYVEHGLAMYIETKKHKLLVDTGQSERTWENAKVKGVDISMVDTVILSHGHYDHSGGLMKFASMNSHADIYMRDNAGGEYYSYKDGSHRYIGIDKEIVTLPKVHLVSGNKVIDDELSLFTNVEPKRSWPKGNNRLHEMKNGEFVQDRFSHEQYLVIRYGNEHGNENRNEYGNEHGNEYENGNVKYALISGCAHNGILNILDTFRKMYGQDPSIVISGFHMIQQEYSDDDIEEIKNVAKELRKMDTIFYTGHCTGETAFGILKEHMGEKLFAISRI